ncbi:glycosyltransferase family 1 protein [Candidatus Jorgensenbacteria bacterium]|nr:glycosyltransferase family 1 protein [Candidatus Jorgensenbacteria bacterium]
MKEARLTLTRFLYFMRIAYFIGTLKEEDGVSRVLLRLATAMKEAGHESVIITSHAENPERYPVPVLLLPGEQIFLYKDYYFPKPTSGKEVEKHLESFKPELIHLHSPDTSAWLAITYAKHHNLPTVITHHTDFIRYLPYYHLTLFKPLLWMYLRKTYNRITAVTTPSDVITETLKQHGIKHAETLSNGVDIEKFNPRFRKNEWRNTIAGSPDTPIILFVGRLTWEKDLKTLIQTYDLLEKNDVRFRLAIVGDGPVYAELRKALPHATFLGHLIGEALSTAYASADIFLFPSTTETFGNVTVEAMSSGAVPIVARAGGSISIVQDEKNGFLVTPKDAQAFYEKVVFLIQNPDTREKIIKDAILRAKAFAWPAIITKYINLYNKLITK